MRPTISTNILLAVAALAMACSGDPTENSATADQPSLAVIQNEVTQTTGTATNDCTGEVITATATDHELVTVTEDGAGGFHLKLLSHVHFAGTSDITGAKYSGTGSINQTIFDRGTGHIETLVITFTLIGEGDVPNEVATILFHVTVHPDGTVSSTIDTFRLHCQ
jgi:hypothetical protein